MKWKDVYKGKNPKDRMVIFYYRGQVYIGHCTNQFSRRPVKWKWLTDCGNYFDMEELEYDEKDVQPIRYWIPLPIRPDHIKKEDKEYEYLPPD